MNFITIILTSKIINLIKIFYYKKMNNDLNITEEEYNQINADEVDDSLKINVNNIKKVSIILINYFFN